MHIIVIDCYYLCNAVISLFVCLYVRVLFYLVSVLLVGNIKLRIYHSVIRYVHV